MCNKNFFGAFREVGHFTIDLPHEQLNSQCYLFLAIMCNMMKGISIEYKCNFILRWILGKIVNWFVVLVARFMIWWATLNCIIFNCQHNVVIGIL